MKVTHPRMPTTVSSRPPRRLSDTMTRKVSHTSCANDFRSMRALSGLDPDSLFGVAGQFHVPASLNRLPVMFPGNVHRAFPITHGREEFLVVDNRLHV